MKEKVFNECIARMELLELSPKCISAFRHGKVWESEGIGALYEVNEEEQAIITEFEKKHEGYKVYHMIHNLTEFGELYSLLYVSTDTEEWKMDRADLQDNYILAYVYNKTSDYCSEFGSIMIRKNIGGLVRIG